MVNCQNSLLSTRCAVESRLWCKYNALFANTEQVKTTSSNARPPRTEWVTARFAVFPPPPGIGPAQATCIGAGVSSGRRWFSIVLTRSVSVCDSVRCHHLSSLDSEHLFAGNDANAQHLEVTLTGGRYSNRAHLLYDCSLYGLAS